MYNRYIPQADGTFRRSRIQEVIPAEQELPPEQSAQEEIPPQPIKPVPPRIPPRPVRNPRPANVSSFLKQLLPANFDTEDLMVLLLLLLMSGNSQEQQNNALLTLAIYLFL